MCPRKSPSTWDLGCQPFPASVLMCKSSKGRGRCLQSRGGAMLRGAPGCSAPAGTARWGRAAGWRQGELGAQRFNEH